MDAHHVAHRFDQIALPGQWMQPLHVQQHVPARDVERGTCLRLRAGIVPRERGADGGIDRFHVAPRQPELPCPREQAIAVEGHDRRRTIRAGEEVGPETSGAVMPDFGAVQRQHDRPPPAPGEQHGELGQQSVAVHVHHIRTRNCRFQDTTHPPGARERVNAQQPVERACDDAAVSR